MKSVINRVRNDDLDWDNIVDSKEEVTPEQVMSMYRIAIYNWECGNIDTNKLENTLNNMNKKYGNYKITGRKERYV